MDHEKVSNFELESRYQQGQNHPGYPVRESHPEIPQPPLPPYEGSPEPAPISGQPVAKNYLPGQHPLGIAPGYPVEPPPGFQQLAPPYGPVSSQPVGQSLPPMMTPQSIPNCPPGLEYLSMVDQLLVHQKIELLELMTGFETENKYHIRNILGQDVYFAAEQSGCCSRICCGPIRSFDMRIFDNFQNEVIHINRPLACQSCCFPCCLQTMEVSAPPGTVIGTIHQEWSIFYPNFTVKNANGDAVFRIKGPFWTCSCGKDVNFRITTVDGDEEVGKISKQWAGFVREYFTDADNFGINFPANADPQIKGVLLGALFLIDFMYFETPANKNN